MEPSESNLGETEPGESPDLRDYVPSGKMNGRGDRILVPPENEIQKLIAARRRISVATARERVLTYLEATVKSFDLIDQETKDDLVRVCTGLIAASVKNDRNHQREVLERIQDHWPALEC